MARARSPEKRDALLDAAVREFARLGLGASTAKIAAGAGLAEGTLFTYFPTKEDLLNELFLALKTEVYERIGRGFPHGAPLRERAYYIWAEYLGWALDRPEERNVSVLLNLSPIISEVTRHCLVADRKAIDQVMKEVGRQGVFAGLPPGFASSAMLAMQEAAIETATRLPRRRARIIEGAFDAFWRMAE